MRHYHRLFHVRLKTLVFAELCLIPSRTPSQREQACLPWTLAILYYSHLFYSRVSSAGSGGTSSKSLRPCALLHRTRIAGPRPRMQEDTPARSCNDPARRDIERSPSYLES